MLCIRQVTSLNRWNRACFTCGVKLLEYRCVQVWIIAKDQSRAWLADSSKAYKKHWALHTLLHAGPD